MGIFLDSFLKHAYLEAWHDKIKGGKADKAKPEGFDQASLSDGAKHEMEHTKSRRLATEIAMDHLVEDKDYYVKLHKMEKKAFWRGFEKQAGPIGDFLKFHGERLGTSAARLKRARSRLADQILHIRGIKAKKHGTAWAQIKSNSKQYGTKVIVEGIPRRGTVKKIRLSND